MKINFFYKLFFSFMALSIIPLVIIGSIIYVFLTNVLQDSFSKQAYESVIKLSGSLDNTIVEQAEIVIKVLRQDEEIRKALAKPTPEQSLNIDRRILALDERLNIAIYILDSKGKAVYPASLADNIDTDYYDKQGVFKKAARLRNDCIIHSYSAKNPGGEYIPVSIIRSLLDERDSVLGYIIIEVNKNNIIDAVNKLNNNFNMDLILLDPQFKTLADLMNPRMDGKSGAYPFIGPLKAKQNGTMMTSFRGKKCIITFYKSTYTRFYVIGILPLEFILASGNFIKYSVLTACLISFGVCLALALVFARHMTGPINDLIRCIKQVEKGDLSGRVAFRRNDELEILGKHFNRMLDRLTALLDDVVKKQQELRAAEIKALQAQINPHFLYNTLDSIKWIAKIHKIDTITAIVTQLGKLLRSSFSKTEDIVTVEDTLSTLKSYLEIENIRDNGRLTIKLDIDPVILDCKIPKLILQPIVENAVIHGLQNRSDRKPVLQIKGRQDDQFLIFEIIDNGVGIDGLTLEKLHSGQDISSSGSIGVQNVQRRIELFYGHPYGLTIESTAGEGTKVTLRFPIIREVDGKNDYDLHC